MVLELVLYLQLLLRGILCIQMIRNSWKTLKAVHC
nr:MAG TPA: hypothetical protein [Caudoviricetes sp.]